MGNVAEEITKKLLIDAGIKKGLRVLDVGCGRGDVCLLLADMVGTEGTVLGLDFDETSLSYARARVQENNITNVTFIKNNLSDLTIIEDKFDAIIGRRVLMYLPEPKKVITSLSKLLKVGGIMVFQEHDSTMSPGSIVPMPLHSQVTKWIWDTVELEGGNIRIGFDLWNLLSQERLVVDKVRAEGILQTPDSPYPIAPIVRAMLHRIIEKGVATAEEIDIDTLEDRLTEEREKSNCTYVKEMVFCAWARKTE
ncbi:class I SAM-dependent methyltransferase [Clostridium sp. YIM B02505]|uniref:Class I SAM-dependent methyltransferase n=1 Tax=Clostridium yunnanense TaxID=2800325 RepID=A0ABS1ES32_9CLOT|nr:class I SAM-dependent methyltransferase [Clostridium yunnanense]MBK1812156.1 class I SAM-dependent methyltransferase [Clostridium yunnanense]